MFKNLGINLLSKNPNDLINYFGKVVILKLWKIQLMGLQKNKINNINIYHNLWIKFNYNSFIWKDNNNFNWVVDKWDVIVEIIVKIKKFDEYIISKFLKFTETTWLIWLYLVSGFLFICS